MKLTFIKGRWRPYKFLKSCLHCVYHFKNKLDGKKITSVSLCHSFYARKQIDEVIEAKSILSSWKRTKKFVQFVIVFKALPLLNLSEVELKSHVDCTSDCRQFPVYSA